MNFIFISIIFLSSACVTWHVLDIVNARYTNKARHTRKKIAITIFDTDFEEWELQPERLTVEAEREANRLHTKERNEATLLNKHLSAKLYVK